MWNFVKQNCENFYLFWVTYIRYILPENYTSTNKNQLVEVYYQK